LSDDLFLCQVSKGSEMEQTQYVSIITAS
jgi:hypothetical protein